MTYDATDVTLSSHMRAFIVLCLALLSFDAAVSASPCQSSKAMTMTKPPEVVEFFRSRQATVVTFLGYSGAGYEDAAAMLREASAVMQKLPRDRTFINSGATEEGIGAIYAEAKRLGFKTSGIVSTQARKDNVGLSTCVDHVFYIDDDSWGGYLPDGKTLSPTSEAMVAASDRLVAIGGGDIARDELLEARKRGKQVAYIPADMNHQVAREKAARKGQPEPKEFRGSVHSVWSQSARAQ